MTLQQYARTIPNAEWEIDEWNAFPNKKAWLKAHNAALTRQKAAQKKAAKKSKFKPHTLASVAKDVKAGEHEIDSSTWARWTPAQRKAHVKQLNDYERMLFEKHGQTDYGQNFGA